MYVSLRVCTQVAFYHTLPTHTLYFYTLTDVIEARNVTVFFPFVLLILPPFYLIS